MNCTHGIDTTAVQRVHCELASITKENTYLRGQLQSVKCPYGHKNESGVCSLGYPGCACADDWFVAQDEMHRDIVARLAAVTAERDTLKIKLNSLCPNQPT